MFIFFNDITVATETCDLNTVYYTLGKLTLAMFKVSPVTGLRQGFIEEKEKSFKFKYLSGDTLDKINQIGEKVDEF